MIKYFAKPIQEIEKGKTYWNYQLIGVFQQEDNTEPVKIGEYIRNYSSFSNTFFAFRHANDKWYAIYSPEYTGTRIMELPSCKDIGGEPPDGNGFCPMGYYIPTYIDFKYKDHEPIRASQINPEDVKLDELNSPEDIRHWHFGFVAGCIWGDDWSTKIEYLDLSEADKGIVKRSSKFGYIWLPHNVALKDAIDMDCYDGKNETMIRIATDLRFFTDNTYENFDLSDVTEYIDMTSSYLHACPDCKVEEGIPHLDTCKAKKSNIPYIYYPRICSRCGKYISASMKIAESIWTKYIPFPQDSFAICLTCFLRNKAIIEKIPYQWQKNTCFFCRGQNIKNDPTRKSQPFLHVCQDCGSGWW